MIDAIALSDGWVVQITGRKGVHTHMEAVRRRRRLSSGLLVLGGVDKKGIIIVLLLIRDQNHIFEQSLPTHAIPGRSEGATIDQASRTPTAR